MQTVVAAQPVCNTPKLQLQLDRHAFHCFSCLVSLLEARAPAPALQVDAIGFQMPQPGPGRRARA
eukprot:9302001-Lingulodinium_polyedra.AAC.1